MATHKVQVQPSAREFPVGEGQTVLAAALDAGVILPYGCKDGACGSCKGRVLAGRVHHGAHASSALTPEEEAAGLALFCCAAADTDLVIEARVAAPFDGCAPRRMPARIERIERPAPDVAVLRLTLAAGERLAYLPGQYVDFLLAGGARRSYSIASRPGVAGPLEFHIRHMPGGIFTDTLFGATASVKERGILRIEGPLGTFHLREDAGGPIVLLASGTGFAPLKAIVEEIFARGIERTRPVVLYWGARTRADLYLDELPRRWEREHGNFRYVPVISEADADAAQAPHAPWTGRTGLVHRAVMADLPDLSTFEVYASGAPVMVQAAHRDLVAHCRLREENFYADAFVSRADLPAPTLR